MMAVRRYDILDTPVMRVSDEGATRPETFDPLARSGLA
ncbi:hypothetical protein ABIE41_000170 [Bosea sp. OAE506]